MATVTETLRRALNDCGEPILRVAKDAGISYSVMYRFYHGERDLRLSAADKLAAYFNLELKPRRQRRSQRLATAAPHRRQ